MSRIRANQITNQSADGAPTVQNGLVISGVTTSTTFSGSGASLTNLPSAQLTGALPALDGSNLTGISGVSVANQADNRLLTATGTTDALNGETNLTFSGSTLKVNNASGHSYLKINSSDTYSGVIHFGDQSDDDAAQIWYDNYQGNGMYLRTSENTPISFYTNSLARVRITNAGEVGIGTVTPNSTGGVGGGGLHIHGPQNDNVRVTLTTPSRSNPGSRIGYYGLNRFGIDTYDGIEMRDVTRSYATIFKIDQNGYMTTNQPYGHLRFNVENDTGSFVTQTNVHTADVQNGMSHNGSGRLTVPAAGKYMIMLGCNLLDNSQMQFRMMKNGSDIPGVYFQNSDSDEAWKSGSRTIVLPLSANDYIESRIIGKQDSQVWNHLTVYMLG